MLRVTGQGRDRPNAALLSNQERQRGMGIDGEDAVVYGDSCVACADYRIRITPALIRGSKVHGQSHEMHRRYPITE